MTGTELSANLGLRLEDAGENIFTSQMKVNAINAGQKQIVNLVENKYLAELQVIKSGQALAAGLVSFTSASIAPIRDGIVGIYDATNDKWCTMVEPGEIKSLENSYLSGDTTNPTVHIFDETIYVNPTSVGTIDIWYLNSPTDYTTSNLANSCELNAALQETLLDIAESQLWRIDGRSDRAQLAYQSAVSVLQMLNGRTPVDITQSIGTAGR